MFIKGNPPELFLTHTQTLGLTINVVKPASATSTSKLPVVVVSYLSLDMLL